MVNASYGGEMLLNAPVLDVVFGEVCHHLLSTLRAQEEKPALLIDTLLVN